MKIFILLVSFVVAGPAPAAEAARDESKLPLAIFCAAYVEGLKSVFVKTGADTYSDVALSTANVVEVEDALIEAGRITLHGRPNGNNVYPVVATADVSRTPGPLVILVPGKDADRPVYDSKVVAGSLDQFPLGSYSLVNMSAHSMRVTAGSEVIEIKAGGVGLLKFNVPAGSAMPVTIDQQNGEDWQLVSSAQWASRDDRRTLVCFVLDPASKRMMVKSVPIRDTGGK